MEPEADLETLMVRYQQGDLASATALIQGLSPFLHRFFMVQFVSRRHADDLLQETLLRIHEVRHTYGERLLPWIYAIALHVRVDHFRRVRRVEVRKQQVEVLPEIASARPSDARPDIVTLLAALPEGQREVIAMLKMSHMFWRKWRAPRRPASALKLTGPTPGCGRCWRPWTSIPPTGEADMRDRDVDDILRREAPEEVDPAILDRISNAVGPSLRPVRPLPPARMLVCGLLLVCAAAALGGAALLGFDGIQKLSAAEISILFPVLGVLAWMAATSSADEMTPGSPAALLPCGYRASVSSRSSHCSQACFTITACSVSRPRVLSVLPPAGLQRFPPASVLGCCSGGGFP
jgi:RNA polymerase sigma-70 factor (ECF subfamily)